MILCFYILFFNPSDSLFKESFSKIIPSFFSIKEGVFFYLSVSPARRAPLSPKAPLPQEAGM